MIDPAVERPDTAEALLAALLSVNREVGRVLDELAFGALDIDRLMATRARLGVLRASRSAQWV